MASISIRNLAKKYGDMTVIPDLSLEIPDREFVVLVGPSGCGKSTLLRILAGLEAINDGEVFIGERKVNGVPASKRDIAMVFQDYALYPHMTVRQNMSFALENRGADKAEIERRIREAARLLHIEEYLGRRPKALSGGQRQRVAMGRAIVRDPKVFLFDEPLSNLDAKLRASVRAEIKALSQKLRTTMVFVTHDQVEAMTMADRIVVMKSGIIQQVGSPEEVYEAPANMFVAGFIGSPAMNFLPVRAEGGRLRLETGGTIAGDFRSGIRRARRRIPKARSRHASRTSRRRLRGGGAAGDDRSRRAARLRYADPLRARRSRGDRPCLAGPEAEARRSRLARSGCREIASLRRGRRRGHPMSAVAPKRWGGVR